MSTPSPATDVVPNGGTSRRRGLLIIALAVLLGAAAWAVYWFGHGRWFVATEDAYVGGNIVQVTAEITGTVRAVNVRETESVAAGQPLLELDKADARLAFESATADLANTVRQVRGAFAQVERARAQVTAREVELRRAREDFRRRDSIADGGAVSAEDLAHARDTISGLEAALQAAREDLTVALAQTEGTSTAEHPQVMRAASRVREAALALQRTTIKSPVGGVVGRKGVQVGQRVAPGTPLIGVVPLDDVWVDANFKEVQLQYMRIGQPVTLRSDLYGRGVTLHGTVLGISPGTGAVFALLPPQNASGNWIKIVQRVPVRIALDPTEVREHPLRIGLSMRAKVDLHDQTGPVMTQPDTEVVAAVAAREERDSAVESLIAHIIAANSGAPPQG